MGSHVWILVPSRGCCLVRLWNLYELEEVEHWWLDLRGPGQLFLAQPCFLLWER